MNLKRSVAFSCIILAALLLIAGAGCPKKGAGNKAAAAKETVIAEFDGGKVTAEEINTLINIMPPMYRMQLQNPDYKEKFITQIIESKVFAKAAKDAGMENDPETKIILDLQLSAVLASQYFNKKIKPLGDKIQTTDAELKDYYDKHPMEFDQTKIKARHILVSTEQEAKDIYAKVKANPKSFAAIAKEKSMDKNSGAQGGDLGWIEHGRMVPDFEKVAFSLQKGEISEPFQTQFGWHLVMLDDKSEVSQIPFDQAKESIRAKLSEPKKQKVLEKALQDTKDKLKLKVHKDLFSKVGMELSLPSGHPSIGTPPPPPPPPSEAPAQPQK